MCGRADTNASFTAGAARGKWSVTPAAPHAVPGSSPAGALPAPEPYELCHSGSLCVVPSVPKPGFPVSVFVSVKEICCLFAALWCLQLCCDNDRQSFWSSAGPFQAALFTRHSSIFHFISFLLPQLHLLSALTLSFPGSSHQYRKFCCGFRRTARRFPRPPWSPFAKSS